MNEEKEDQRSILHKQQKYIGYLTIVFAFILAFNKLTTDQIDLFMFTLTGLTFLLWSYYSFMAKKPNREMWRIWERMWGERRTLYLAAHMAFPIILLTIAFLFTDLNWFITVIGAIFFVLTIYKTVYKQWEKKKHYLKLHNGKQ
ncbi:hypothetical protein [Halobacillus mangrovi]|uniref:hypothetical protein n=1 Tax=Halobacillus mangrovi TaxID=402384 RepID=UPI003D9522ED